MSDKLLPVIQKAKAALAGKPAWNHTLVADFGSDGVLCIYPHNEVASIPSANVAADCTITTTLQTLEDLEAGRTTAFSAWWSGALKIDGSRSVAEKFAALITGKS